jgi:hypothetical protein
MKSRNIYKTTINDYVSNKTTQEFVDINYNPFSPLVSSNVECYKCNNFGHKAHECRSILESTRQNMNEKYSTKHEKENTRVWKKKPDQQKGEENNLALHARSNTSQWYIDNGCSKHMTRDQNMFLTLDKTKGGNVMFGNDNSAKIIGKGTICLGSEKAKEKNVLLIEDMKHNLLSVSQICDQGHTLDFDSQKCEIRSEKYGRLVATTLRTPNNIYILDEVKGEKCCMGQIDQSWLWHRRMGHINFDNLVKINKKKVVRDFPLILKPSNPICKHCQHGKKTRVTFKTKEHSTSKPLQLIHIDLCGPTITKRLQGEHYFMLLIDDYTIMTWVSFLKKKSKAIDKFKVFKELVENETDLKIKCLQSDNGGDFTSNEFEKFCEMHGIKRQFLVARTPQQNGVAERKNRTVQEMARTMLNDSKL